MSAKHRIICLVIIMTVLVIVTGTVAITGLYRTALNEELNWLVETSQSQARLIEAVARFDISNSKYTSLHLPTHNPKSATLSQIYDSHTL